MSDPRSANSEPDPARLRQINHAATSARLVSGLAHELNNALQVVSGLVELLSGRADVPADALERIQRIGAQADKASSAIRQVVAATREAREQASTADVSAVLDQVLALRRYGLGRAGITVEVERPPGPIAVTADPRAVLHVLMNLVVNAEEALAGHPRRQLRIQIAREDGAVRVAVSDTGPGIEAAVRDRVFEPFFTTRTGELSLGLGLPVAQGLAGQSGGRLTLQDAGPGTTTFVVSWPA